MHSKEQAIEELEAVITRIDEFDMPPTLDTDEIEAIMAMGYTLGELRVKMGEILDVVRGEPADA